MAFSREPLLPETKLNQTKSKSSSIMGNLLYIVAVVLVIAWLVGFVGYSAGGIIHILLVIAVVAILLQVIQGRRIA